MKLIDRLIATANRGYHGRGGDSMVKAYYEKRRRLAKSRVYSFDGQRDLMAALIAEQVALVYDPNRSDERNISAAISAIRGMERELEGVDNALFELFQKNRGK